MFSFFRFLRLFRRRRRPTALPARRREHFLPRIEALEERWVPSTTSIGGYVYNDVNNNGIFDTGEQGIANNTIQLYNSAGTLIGTTQTDANGHYLFTTDSTINTTPKTQSFTANFPSTPTDSSLTQSIAKFDPSLGTLNSVEIEDSGSLTSSIKIDSLDTTPSTVTGTVSGTLTLSGPGLNALTLNPTTNEQANVGASNGQMDFTGPSTYDFGAKTASDSKDVTLDASQTDLSAWIGTGTVSLNETAQATSSATGPGNLLSLINSSSEGQVTVVYNYTPSNALVPGNYTVTQPQVPTGYAPGKTTNNNQTPLPYTPPPESIPVVLTNGGSPSNNFGELKASSLSGFVYYDSNNSGVLVTGDPGIAGVSIQLTGTDVNGNAVSQTTTTANDGSYSFQNLLPGTYTLTKTSTPSGYMDGKITAGSTGGQTGKGDITQIVLNQGTSGTNNNFAEIKPASVSGFVYNDANNNGVMDAPPDTGIGGVTLTLTGTTNDNQQVSATTTTAADGSYSFGSLLPGKYVITETQPSGYLPGSMNLGNLPNSTDNTSTDQFFIQLGMGDTGINYDYGELLPAPPPPPPVQPPDTPTPPPPPAAPAPPPAATAPSMPAGIPPSTPTNPFAALSKFWFMGSNIHLW